MKDTLIEVAIYSLAMIGLVITKISGFFDTGVDFLFPAFVACVGMLAIFGGWEQYKIARRSISWRKTTGIILKSQVIRSQKSKKSSKWVYSPEIHYNYTANNQIYKSSQIFIGSENYSTKSKKRVNKYVGKYPAGREVMVYYAPNIHQLADKEGHSVLETGVKYTVYLGLFVSALIGVGSCIFLVDQYSTKWVYVFVGFILALHRNVQLILIWVIKHLFIPILSVIKHLFIPILSVIKHLFIPILSVIKHLFILVIIVPSMFLILIKRLFMLIKKDKKEFILKKNSEQVCDTVKESSKIVS